MGFNNLLLDHVRLPHVVIVAVHLVIFCAGWVKGTSQDILTKGTLLSECSFMVKSYGVVVVCGGHSLVPNPSPQSQSPIPVPNPSLQSQSPVPVPVA